MYGKLCSSKETGFLNSIRGNNQMVKRTACITLSTLLLLTTAACSSGGESSSGSSTPPAGTSAGSESSPGQSPNVNASKTPQPEKGAKLLLWEDQEAMGYIKEAVKAFQEKYGIEVKVEEVPAPDQAGRLANDGPAGVAADVVMFAHDKLGDAAEAGLLLPNDIFEKPIRERNQPAAIEAATYKNVLYGYPKSVETYGLFYNKDLIKEAPKTWDDVVAFAKTFNDPANKKYAIMWEARLTYFNYPFIASYGGYFFGKKGTDPKDIGLNNEGAVKGVTYFKSLKNILPFKAENLTYDIKTQLFQEGKVAMNIDGPWSVNSFKDKINLGVAPLPELPGGTKSVSFSGVRSYYVNTYTKYPIASRYLAEFLTNKENSLKNFALTGALPANKEAAEDPAVRNNPISSGFLKQFEHSQPMPSIPEIANAWSPVDGALVSIWNQDADVKSTLDMAAKTIQDQTSKTKK